MRALEMVPETFELGGEPGAGKGLWRRGGDCNLLLAIACNGPILGIADFHPYHHRRIGLETPSNATVSSINYDQKTQS